MDTGVLTLGPCCCGSTVSLIRTKTAQAWHWRYGTHNIHGYDGHCYLTTKLHIAGSWSVAAGDTWDLAYATSSPFTIHLASTEAPTGTFTVDVVVTQSRFTGEIVSRTVTINGTLFLSVTIDPLTGETTTYQDPNAPYVNGNAMNNNNPDFALGYAWLAWYGMCVDAQGQAPINFGGGGFTYDNGSHTYTFWPPIYPFFPNPIPDGYTEIDGATCTYGNPGGDLDWSPISGLVTISLLDNYDFAIYLGDLQTLLNAVDLSGTTHCYDAFGGSVIGQLRPSGSASPLDTTPSYTGNANVVAWFAYTGAGTSGINCGGQFAPIVDYFSYGFDGTADYGFDNPPGWCSQPVYNYFYAANPSSCRTPQAACEMLPTLQSNGASPWATIGWQVMLTKCRIIVPVGQSLPCILQQLEGTNYNGVGFTNSYGTVTCYHNPVTATSGTGNIEIDILPAYSSTFGRTDVARLPGFPDGISPCCIGSSTPSATPMGTAGPGSTAGDDGGTAS